MSVAEPPVLRIRLDAPSWMTIDFVRSYVGGVLVNEFVLTPEMAAGDWLLDTTFEPEITGDSYIVVAAGSSREEARMPGYGRFPVTVANPIWLDSDGNGWEARFRNEKRILKKGIKMPDIHDDFINGL